jgi:hypothetical protein
LSRAPLLDLQSHLFDHHRKLNHLNRHQSPLEIETGYDEYCRGCENGIVVNKNDDGRSGLGCGCVDVGFENPAAIRKFLFQSSTSRGLMLKVNRTNNQ